MPHGGYEGGNKDCYSRPLPEFSYDLETDRDNDEYITFYRGVGENSHSTIYNLAERAIAVPRAFVPDESPGIPHMDPEKHTWGDNFSFHTSWSKDFNFARSAALKHSSSGVVITHVVKKSEMIISNSSLVFPFDGEQEVQLIGIQIGWSATKVGIDANE